METERLALFKRVRFLVDRKEIGELAAEQLLRFRLKVVGELVRDVGKGADRIGLPEPPATAGFELVDEMLGLPRLCLEAQPLAAGRDEVAGADNAVGENDEGQCRDSAEIGRASCRERA